MRNLLLIALVGFVPLTAACSDGLGTNTFPRLSVAVNEASIQNGGKVGFGQALQQTVARDVQIESAGGGAVRIDGIDWAVDEVTGQQLKNPYVEIDWQGSVDASSFPWVISPSNNNALSFAIEFTPPLGKPLDDTRDSVLVIKTNAYNDDASARIKEFRITFSLLGDNASPQVTPARSYTFENATQARGETQEFRIYNDEAIATSPFHITNVYLETPSTEFTLSQVPASGTTVLEPGNPGHQEVVFKVTYQPKDDIGPDRNAVIIETDVGSSGTLRVELLTSTTIGAYSISYREAEKFDFGNVSSIAERSVQITCDGPGPITFKQPHIEPSESRPHFSFKAFVPASSPDQPDVEVTSWPRALNVGRSLIINVTYAPDDDEPMNGALLIPYENPNPGEIEMPLLAGEPKSKIALAPKTGTVSVTGSIIGGDKGTRFVAVYNEGNGPLEVKGAIVHKDFDLPATVWSLAPGFAPFTVPPGGVHLVEVAYDLSKITAQDKSETEYLEITYFDDFIGADSDKLMGLFAGDTNGKSNPVASLTAPSGLTAGTAFSLDGSGSTAASGTIDNNGYVFYLVAKPAGSLAKLNVQTSSRATFTPDVAGSYGFELFVYATDAGNLLYSAPAKLTVTVGAAP